MNKKMFKALDWRMRWVLALEYAATQWRWKSWAIMALAVAGLVAMGASALHGAQARTRGSQPMAWGSPSLADYKAYAELWNPDYASYLSGAESRMKRMGAKFFWIDVDDSSVILKAGARVEGANGQAMVGRSPQLASVAQLSARLRASASGWGACWTSWRGQACIRPPSASLASRR